MRVRVLPREVAAGVITGSVAMMGWAVAAATLLLTVPVLIETMVRADAVDGIRRPLILLVIMISSVAFVAQVGRPWALLVYLGIGGISATAFEVAAVKAYPAAYDDALFLLNRPSVALVLVGLTATSAVIGIAWSLLGFVVSNLSALAVAAFLGLPFRPGFGPVMVLAIVVVGYLTLAGIQSSQRRRVPNFDELELETYRLAQEENLSRRTIAAVHDTLLNDLSIVMNAPDRLDERVMARLLADLETLQDGDWLADSDPVVSDEQDASLRNDIMRLVSDFQWRGLSIHVTGSGSGIYRLAPEVADALIDAIRASFENVLRHSGAAVAELELVYTDVITVMVTDQGSGFDLAAVPADRIGLRTSIMQRLRAVGGDVKVWTSPGAGTSIVMTVPIVEVIAPNPVSTHQERS